MTDGDYYAAYADVQYMWQDANLGVAGNGILDANGIEIALKTSQAILHLLAGFDDLVSITHVVYVEVLKMIQLDMIGRRIALSKGMKFTDANEVINFLKSMPSVTDEQLGWIGIIRGDNITPAFTHLYQRTFGAGGKTI